MLIAGGRLVGGVGGVGGRLGQDAGLGVAGQVGAHRDLAGARGQPPSLAGGDGGQPRQAALVERDVGAAQERRPGDLAGVLDGLLGRVGAPRDGALQRGGVLGVEGGDLLRRVRLVRSRLWLSHGGSVAGAFGAGLGVWWPPPPEGESEVWRRAQRLKGSPSGPARRAAAQRCPLRKRARRLHSRAIPGAVSSRRRSRRDYLGCPRRRGGGASRVWARRGCPHAHRTRAARILVALAVALAVLDAAAIFWMGTS